MNSKTKVILSVIGICAVAIPLILLTLLTKKVDVGSGVPQETRSLDQNLLKQITNNNSQNSELLLPSPKPTSLPSPSPSSPSAIPVQGTGSAF